MNFILMIMTIVVCAGFGSSTAISQAYGVTVSSVMIITTFLYAIVIHFCYHSHILKVIFFICIFFPLDMLYWTANLTKIPTVFI